MQLRLAAKKTHAHEKYYFRIELLWVRRDMPLESHMPAMRIGVENDKVAMM